MQSFTTVHDVLTECGRLADVHGEADRAHESAAAAAAANRPAAPAESWEDDDVER